MVPITCTAVQQEQACMQEARHTEAVAVAAAAVTADIACYSSFESCRHYGSRRRHHFGSRHCCDCYNFCYNSGSPCCVPHRYACRATHRRAVDRSWIPHLRGHPNDDRGFPRRRHDLNDSRCRACMGGNDRCHPCGDGRLDGGYCRRGCCRKDANFVCIRRRSSTIPPLLLR